ncbi:hypothetical protein JHK84_032368 [Glycine max]|nr:hypothetical protein JHK84_032368 [Glycine max]
MTSPWNKIHIHHSHPSPSPPPPLSDSDSDDCGGDSSSSAPLRHSDLSDSIFKPYLELSGHSGADLSKIQSFLTSSSAGALSCLICLERIKPSDPTWSCSSLCFAVFHLFCIQSWARQASDLAAARAATRLPISPATASASALWNCPKCRSEYPKSHIPKTYFCFCGKIENPPNDPWILPHSCGEVCGRPLKHSCGHHCLLLCHPGPCPSCPKLVKVRCFCGCLEDVRRCGFKEFSCNKPCSKFLDCGVHRCIELCHPGACPPCRTRGVHACQCAKVKEERECCDRVFQCGNPCEKRLGCGKHVCERGCHSGKCGECPLKGKRTCPCGKRVYEGMPCDAPVQLCGATCDKMLPCGYHRCPERCHRGQCVETCRVVVKKSCRCGSLKKDSRFLAIKIWRAKGSVRGCVTAVGMLVSGAAVMAIALPALRYAAGSFDVRTINALLHAIGMSSVCISSTLVCIPLENKAENRAGQIAFRLRSGHPNCLMRALCSLPNNGDNFMCMWRDTFLVVPKWTISHLDVLNHVLSLLYVGMHQISRCHGAKPPPNPEFTLKPKKKKIIQQSESVPGTPCPPCPELVWRSCVGKHIGAERMMVCSDKSQFSCENLCGNPVPCGNHYCTKTCHALENQKESLHVHITALGDAILETVLHARCSLNGHVTVVQWSMCLSAYITTACLQRVKRLSAHVVGHVTESCQIVHIYAQRHVILVNAQMLRNAVKRSLFDANAIH